jgi:2,5-diketo-D-gluconate reductase A
MPTIPMINLHDGNQIPQFGLGVYQVGQDEAVATVLEALKAGYRHIDTAQMYGNEEQVGEAIKQSGIDRKEIFITSKLNNGYHIPEDARGAFDDTLAKLGTDYIDLFLIHWPLPGKYDGDFVSTWKTLCEFKQDGRAKSVGVSNFQVAHLERLLAESDELPAVNQIELQPYFQNREVAAFCAEHNIAVEAWSPIAQGRVLDDPVILEIAEASGKSAAQVVLRWHIQKGYIIFPKSSNAERIRDNINIFDFELTDDQMAQIDGLDNGEAGRNGPNPDEFNYIP